MKLQHLAVIPPSYAKSLRGTFHAYEDGLLCRLTEERSPRSALPRVSQVRSKISNHNIYKCLLDVASLRAFCSSSVPSHTSWAVLHSRKSSTQILISPFPPNVRKPVVETKVCVISMLSRIFNFVARPVDSARITRREVMVR